MQRINYDFPQPTKRFTFEMLGRSNALPTGNSQGVCFDGTYYYYTADNGIYKFTRSGNIYNQVSFKNCTTDSPIEKTEINEIVFFNGALWAGANNFGAGNHKGWMLKYDPDTLSLIDYFETKNYWNEGGAWTNIQGIDNLFVVFSDWDHCSRYQFVNGALTHIDDYIMPLVIGQTHIIGERGLYQGCIWYRDILICATHATNPDSQYHYYKWNGNGFDPIEYSKSIVPNAGQGLSWEVEDEIMLFAERDVYGDLNSNTQRIIRAVFHDTENE